MTDPVESRPSTTEEYPVVDVQMSSDTTISQVKLIGELDMATVEKVRDTLVGLARSGHRDVEVDLSGLEFIDVVGARALLAAHHAMRDTGGRLTVTGARATARRMLRITGDDKTLDLG